MYFITKKLRLKFARGKLQVRQRSKFPTLANPRGPSGKISRCSAAAQRSSSALSPQLWPSALVGDKFSLVEFEDHLQGKGIFSAFLILLATKK